MASQVLFWNAMNIEPGIEFGSLFVIGKLRQTEYGSSLCVLDRFQIGAAFEREGVNVTKNDNVFRCVSLNDIIHPGTMRCLVGIFLN